MPNDHVVSSECELVLLKTYRLVTEHSVAVDLQRQRQSNEGRPPELSKDNLAKTQGLLLAVLL